VTFFFFFVANKTIASYSFTPYLLPTRVFVFPHPIRWFGGCFLSPHLFVQKGANPLSGYSGSSCGNLISTSRAGPPPLPEKKPQRTLFCTFYWSRSIPFFARFGPWRSPFTMHGEPVAIFYWGNHAVLSVNPVSPRIYLGPFVPLFLSRFEFNRPSNPSFFVQATGSWVCQLYRDLSSHLRVPLFIPPFPKHLCPSCACVVPFCAVDSFVRGYTPVFLFPPWP